MGATVRLQSEVDWSLVTLQPIMLWYLLPKKKNGDRESIAKDVKFCSNFTIPTTLICLVLFLMFASEEHLLTMNGIFPITLEGKQEFGVRLQLLPYKFESSHNLFAG